MDHLEHSPLGGSGAKRFLNCAGSFLLHRQEIESGAFENIETEYAARGTAAHLLGSTCLSTGREPYEYIGNEFEGFIAGWPGGIDLDPVSVYVTHCQKIIDQNPGGEVMIERTLHVPKHHSLLKGTVDFGYWHKGLKRVWLRDYKNGEGVGVYVLDNDQLLYYAFILLLQPQFDTWPPSTVVSLGIVQPNFFGLFEEPETYELTMEQVLAWGYKTLLPRMHYLTAQKTWVESDFRLGDWCQFCPVLLDCPKMQDAFIEFADGEEDFVMLLTNEELDLYYSKRAAARRFMNALDTVINARLVAGNASDFKHAKLVEKRVNRVWRPGAEPVLKEVFGDKALDPAKVKSPAAIEKLSTRGKELALEYGYKPESFGLSVAPMDDPRPAATRKGNAHVYAAYETASVGGSEGW